MNDIILASQSPRRREILAKMGVTFTVVPSEYDEHLDDSRDAQTVAQELALGKAQWVAERHPTVYVIGSDTIVGVAGHQLGKAEGADEARRMLMNLSEAGDTIVTTGVAIVHQKKGIELVNQATTHVFSKPESEDVARARETYIASGNWQGKAGGYGIQDEGVAFLIDRVEGEHDTVVGLPSKLVERMLAMSGAIR